MTIKKIKKIGLAIFVLLIALNFFYMINKYLQLQSAHRRRMENMRSLIGELQKEKDILSKSINNTENICK